MKKDACAECPVAKVASLLSDTWTMLILRDLMKGPLRYKDLTDSLEGISTRTLTQKLERLAEEGIIAKKVPYYAVTAKGKKLGAIFEEMTRYGKKDLSK